MRGYDRETIGSSFDPQSSAQWIRVVASTVGMVVMVIGVVFAVRLFGLIVQVLRHPAGFQARLEEWVAVVGGEQLDVLVGGGSFPAARMVALSVLGGGAVVLAQMAMGLISVGGKTVSSTLSERDAIKRILVDAFGPSGKLASHQTKRDPPQ